jgi:TIR domain-containing protein
MAGTTPTASGRIFISYRREETAYSAGWLYARLVEHFGREQVFKDIDSIELGDEFPRVIAEAVGSCDVLLALIGERWRSIADPQGRRRLDNPGDFVRLEIEAALERDVRVIPILVDGATMPDAGELPPSLARIVHRHGLELSPTRFESDSNRLLRVLDRTLGEQRSQVQAGRGRPPARRWVPMGIAAALLVAGLGAVTAFSALDDDPPRPRRRRRAPRRRRPPAPRAARRLHRPRWS